jgi:hypothetical protein
LLFDNKKSRQTEIGGLAAGEGLFSRVCMSGKRQTQATRTPGRLVGLLLAEKRTDTGCSGLPEFFFANHHDHNFSGTIKKSPDLPTGDLATDVFLQLYVCVRERCVHPQSQNSRPVGWIGFVDECLM